MENEGKSEGNVVESNVPDVRGRRSLFSVLNDANTGNYYWKNDAYEQLVKGEMSEWNYLAKEGASKYMNSQENIKLDNTAVRKKIAALSIDPEAFLAEQKEFVTAAKDFLKQHKKHQEKIRLLTEVTNCLLDDVTIRAMEEHKYI
ncbi:uncharacterized protein LOC129793428 [Lutzomyia longipalpis]|uniref:uncharacterized protein LOC129793428 n=1 Tax=Lutzomyia longipalpis TaxID=7200 RepID=UPI002483B8FC|nr:uncharacterized protein LOC129793428 [Lutzomyia longipalpis]